MTPRKGAGAGAAALPATAAAPVAIAVAKRTRARTRITQLTHEAERRRPPCRIVQAIASRVVDPKRVVMRDQQSYCSILLDNNNRTTLVRLDFNALIKKYIGTFTGREESRRLITDLTHIYQAEELILARIRELEKSGVGGDPAP